MIYAFSIRNIPESNQNHSLKTNLGSIAIGTDKGLVILYSSYKLPQSRYLNKHECFKRQVFYKKREIQNCNNENLIILKQYLKECIEHIKQNDLYKTNIICAESSKLGSQEKEIRVYLYAVDIAIIQIEKKQNSTQSIKQPINQEVKKIVKPQPQITIRNKIAPTSQEPKTSNSDNIKSSNQTSINTHRDWPYIKYGFLIILASIIFTFASRKRVGAICRDGWNSFSISSGTCSSHKGVKSWKYVYWWE